MKKILSKSLLFTVCVIMVSCATVLSGSKENVAVNSEPYGAKVVVNGRNTNVTTPGVVEVKKKKNMEYVFKKDGYNDTSVTQRGKTNPVVYANILLGGIPGLIVDASTGAINKIPTSVFGTLEPDKNAPLPAPVEPQKVYKDDPTIMQGEADNAVSRDRPGQTALERTTLRWYFDSDPRGARLFWRVISSIPHIVKNTNETYLFTTPFEETKSFNILGLTYQNSRDVQIEIKVTRKGYEDQVKRFNVRQAIDQQEISSFFELVKKDE